MTPFGRPDAPKETPRQHSIEPHTSLENRYQAGRIEIEPAVEPLRLVREGRFLVAVSNVDEDILTTETVEAIRQSLVNERGLID